MNIINISKKCVGCGACVDSCPLEILKLKHNIDGFLVPSITNDTCVDCGKCISVCPAIDCKQNKWDGECYYGYSIDETIRSQSSSGGAFSVFANQIIKENGVVFGARYSDDFKEVLMASSDECTLEDLRRSKYCQSNPNGIYKKIGKALSEGKRVLFTGTPCQIAGAKKIFGDKDNLLLVSFICGGVTPPTAFSNYVEWLEKKYNSNLKSINMRDKTAGWGRPPKIRVKFENGKTYLRRYQLDYYYYYYYCTPFLKNDQCITCAFTQHIDSDLTIADFWGYKKANVKNDGKGLSLICAHSEKGRLFLNKVKSELVIVPLDKEYAEYGFCEKKHTEDILKKRQSFLNEIRQTSFVEAAESNMFSKGVLGAFVKLAIRKVIRKLKL